MSATCIPVSLSPALHIQETSVNRGIESLGFLWCSWRVAVTWKTPQEPDDDESKRPPIDRLWPRLDTREKRGWLVEPGRKVPPRAPREVKGLKIRNNPRWKVFSRFYTTRKRAHVVSKYRAVKVWGYPNSQHVLCGFHKVHKISHKQGT